MSEHPIEGLMKTAMDSIKEMIDVNTIVGDPVQSPDGQIIIPISRVSFGFAAGGAEYNGSSKGREAEDSNRANNTDKMPFGGGSGAGVSVQPVAFIVVGNGNMKLLPIDHSTTVLSNILEFIPKLTSSIQGKSKDNVKKEPKYNEEMNN